MYISNMQLLKEIREQARELHSMVESINRVIEDCKAIERVLKGTQEIVIITSTTGTNNESNR